VAGQLCLALPPFRSLPQERNNHQSLCQEHKNPGDDITPVSLPKSWLAIENYALKRQIAFLKPPPTQGLPIKHVDTCASDNRDILRLFPAENPQSHPRGHSTRQDEAGDVPAYRSSTHIYIVHNKHWRIRGAGLHRYRLNCVDEVRSRRIL